ncbi:MAG: hypothetical protein ACOC29_02550 [Candidatus Sumerlaeota bacterium]
MDLTRWMEALPSDVSAAPFPLPAPQWVDLRIDGESESACASTLVLRSVDDPAACDDALAIYAARPAGPEALGGVKRVDTFDEVLAPEEIPLAVFCLQHKILPDMMDAESVAHWMNHALAEHDAPQLALRVPQIKAHNQPLWTAALPKRFAEKYEGEALLDSLALLWLPAPGASDFRLRYRQLVSQALEANLLGPLRRWADEHNKPFYLQMPMEKSLIAQTRSPYGPAERWFEHCDWPVLHFDGSAELPLRQVVSTARHMDLKGVGAECIDGRLGGQAPLIDFRRMAEYALALGANVVLPRSTGKTVLGDAKRADGPNNPFACQSWNDDWLKAAHSLERLSEVLSQGRRVTGVLVVSPSESIEALTPYSTPKALRDQVKLEGKPTDPAMQYQHPFKQLIDALSQFHIDFDLADEETIERIGASRRNTLYLGDSAEYHLVIVPPSLSLRSSTLKLLKRFSRHGGAVLLIRPFAPTIDFQPDKALLRLEDRYPNVDVLERSGRDVCYQLLRLDPHPFSVKTTEGDASSLRLGHRVTETHELYFVANTHEQLVAESTVTLDADGAVRVADPWEPGIWLKDTDETSNQRTFKYNFHPRTADLFAIGGTADLTEAPHQRAPHTTSTRPLAETWEFLRLDPNLAPLHTCRAQMNGDSLALVGSAVGRPGPVAFARIAVAEALADSAEDANELALSFNFDSEIDGRDRNIALLSEPAPGLKAVLNGDPLQFVSSEDCAVPGYLSADAAEALKVGENTLEIFMTLTKDHAPVAPIEVPILAGDFAVRIDDKGEPTLDHEPDLLRNGDWGRQGYPFYAGTIQLHQSFQHRAEGHNRTFLHIPQPPCAAAVRISVGEHDYADVTYAPHRLEVTRRASEGQNALVVEVTASRYNLFGPIHLHNRLTTPAPPAPRDFDAVPREDRKYWNRQPDLAPFGLPKGLAIETYNPSAPPPSDKKKAPSKPEPIEEESDTDAAASEEE